MSTDSASKAGIRSSPRTTCANLVDIGDYVPGLQIQRSLTGAAAIYIRGIGQRDSIPDFDPGVAVYVDGGYLARDGALIATVDVDRIEVSAA